MGSGGSGGVLLAFMSVGTMSGGPTLAFRTPVKGLTVANHNFRLTRLGTNVLPAPNSSATLSTAAFVSGCVTRGWLFVTLAATGFGTVARDVAFLAAVEARDWTFGLGGITLHAIFKKVSVSGSFAITGMLCRTPLIVVLVQVVFRLNSIASVLVGQLFFNHVLVGVFAGHEMNLQ